MRAEKKQLAQDIRDLIGLSPTVFLISYQGLNAGQFGSLRDGLAGAGAECHVVPNRIFRHAARDAGFGDLAEADLKNDTALVSGGQDAVAVAKVLRDFMKDHEAVRVKVTVIEGRLSGPESAAALAELPPKDVLRAMLLGVLAAPAGQLVRVLNAKNASVVYALSAYLKKQEEQAA
jgi:large subunit ribosomal protein L10